MKTTKDCHIAIKSYSGQLKIDWDNFIDSSKNGTFLLKRDYIEYHSYKFDDHSLIFTKNDRILALMPACRIGNKIFSHAGLTYGGMIMSEKCTTADILDAFIILKTQLKSAGIEELIYKPVPHIYHSIPGEEDLYALFRLNASLTSRNVAAVVQKDHPIEYRNIRKTGIRKALKNGITVRESRDFKSFWKVLSDNLMERYQVSPVHSLLEIEKLAESFPDEIKLYCAFNGETVEGGVVIYSTPQVAHCQYISATARGKETGALDLLFHTLINQEFSDKKYFDFGTSNENGGKILNESLIYQKEGFGARAICYDTYTITIQSPAYPFNYYD